MTKKEYGDCVKTVDLLEKKECEVCNKEKSIYLSVGDFILQKFCIICEECFLGCDND